MGSIWTLWVTAFYSSWEAQKSYQGKQGYVKTIPYTSLVYPTGPCTSIVTTSAQRALLYHGFWAYVYTIVVLGPFGDVVPLQALCT